MLIPTRDEATAWYQEWRTITREMAQARNDAIIAAGEEADLFKSDKALTDALAMPSEPADAPKVFPAVNAGFDAANIARGLLQAGATPSIECPYEPETVEWYAWWNGFLNQGASFHRHMIDAYLATLRSDPASPPPAPGA